MTELQTPTPEDRISIQVDEPFTAQVDAADLARAVLATLQAEGREKAEVTLVICDDAEIASLNAQYRGVEGPTDVLSFPSQAEADDPAAAAAFVSAPEAVNYLGDIVIALPYTQRQAAALGRALADELRLLAVHGTLHLLGYDHAEPEEEAAMWAKQEELLGASMGEV